jgi:predicted RNase H-like HicB family nuclease
MSIAHVTVRSDRETLSGAFTSARDDRDVYDLRPGASALPIFTIRRYAAAAAEMADAKLRDNGSVFLEVPALPGVWAEGDTLREALRELQEVIVEWATLKLQDGDRDFPTISGLSLSAI